jgi:hypothetical protein
MKARMGWVIMQLWVCKAERRAIPWLNYGAHNFEFESLDMNMSYTIHAVRGAPRRI